MAAVEVLREALGEVVAGLYEADKPRPMLTELLYEKAGTPKPGWVIIGRAVHEWLLPRLAEAVRRRGLGAWVEAGSYVELGRHGLGLGAVWVEPDLVVVGLNGRPVAVVELKVTAAVDAGLRALHWKQALVYARVLGAEVACLLYVGRLSGEVSLRCAPTGLKPSTLKNQHSEHGGG